MDHFLFPQSVQLNPVLYWGQDIIRIEKNSVWDEEIVWLYDTHTAKLFAFSEEESVFLKKLRSVMTDPSHPHPASPLLGRGEKVEKEFPGEMVKQLIKEEILLARPREVRLPKSTEAEVWLQSNHFCNLACPGCSTGMDVKQKG